MISGEPLGISVSPCPNDTFLFCALFENHIPGFALRPHFADIHTLNQDLLARKPLITKASFYTGLRVLDDYQLCPKGAAMGHDCGPLLVSRDCPLSQVQSIAVPGDTTTAHLLLAMFLPPGTRQVFMRYDRIPGAVLDGTVDAGCIIHESRFTAPALGLQVLQDLGKWWHAETEGLPLPLGGIFMARSLAASTMEAFSAAIAASLDWARTHRDQALRYCRKYAQEMDEQVLSRHIDLYVNEYTKDIGDRGHAAVERLLAMAREKNLL